MKTNSEAAQAWAVLCRVDAGHEAALDLSAHSKRLCFDPQSLMISQGEQGEHVLLLTHGRAKVTYLSEDGRQIWLSDCGPGSLLGEIACLTGKGRTSFIYAATPVEALSLSRDVFHAALQTHNVFCRSVLQLVVDRLSRSSFQMVETIALPVSSRVLWTIARIGVPHSDDPERFTAKPPPVVTEIAERIHATREATSRAISDLVKRGFLKRSDIQWDIWLPGGRFDL